MAEFEIPADQVPQEALAVLDASPEPISNDASPEPISNEVEIDPVDTLDSAGLFELANKKMFSPIEYAQANPDKATNPDALRKLADTHARIRERGFTFSDLPSAGQAVKGVGHMIAGAAKQAWNYANAFVGIPLAGVAGAVTGQGDGFSEELDLEGQRRMIENLAGTESAVTGLAQLPGRAIGKVIHRAGTVSGLGKRYTEQSEQDKSKAFFDDLGKAQVAGEIVQGKGGLTGAVSSETQKELVQAGKPIRPSEVETLAAGDPLSFMLFGKAFGAAGGAVSKVLPSGGGALIQKASEAATKVGGRAIQTAGKLTEFGGAATKVAGKVLPIVGAVKGTAVAGPAGTIGGLAAGGVAGRTTERIGRGIAAAGEDVAQFGERVATGANVTPYVQAARDVFASAPIVASDVAQGAGFDLALAAATSESPQETEAAAAFGTVLGGLKGVGRGALKVAQGQILLPRQWGSSKVVPSYGSFSALDALHSQASATAAPGVTLRANAIREFLQGSGDKVQAYLLPDAASMEKAVTDILIRQGASPEAAQATARSAAESKGMFANELVDDAGVSRRVVLLNEVDAAPHEAFHGIQDVLGEAGNQIVDGLVFQEYATQWEGLGQQYARRLGGASENWRETVLDKSGWGNAAAAEKALRDAANKIEAESGATATPEAARALAEGVLQNARESGAGWRDILTTEEATAEANRYLARELAAENFDAAFKRLGAGLTEGNTLPEKLARIIAKTAAFLGAEPLSGTRTEGLSIEPRQAVTEAVVGLGRELIQPRTEAPAPTVAKPVEAGTRAAEGGKAVLMADELAVRNPASSQILRKIASAISSGQGLKVDYRTAPGEPAGNPASSRDQRRAVIEAFRDMPEAVRPLWEKLNFPDRVEATKNKGFQIVGWSPENFAANAAKMARFIAEVSPKAPEAKAWSQYEIDPATKSFTPAGWEKLYEDVQTFVANQQAGGTGSGRPLQLPANAAELNISVPRLQEGSLKPLNQAAADFINTLFNLPIPETPRISRKGGTPGNIVAQDIARANEPLVGPRVVEPGRARSEAEFKGFSGRKIQEVNPLRARMEKSASDAGVSFPSLIETSQRLNLDHVADVTAAPEALPVRGVTDTLRAGFLPAEIAGKPAAEVAEKILKSSAQEFIDLTTSYKGEKYGGGQTGLSIDIGRSLKTAEDLQAYRKAAAEIPALSAAAKANKDINTMFSLPYRTQFFREVLEAATEGSTTSEYIKKHYDPNYKAPFPKEGVLPEAQFLPGQDYRRPSLDWEKITEGLFKDPNFPESRSQSLKKDYLEAVKVMNSGIEPDNWSSIPYSVQKKIRAIADYRYKTGGVPDYLRKVGGNYYEAPGQGIEHRGTSKFPPDDTSGTSQFLPKKGADETKLLPAGAAGVSKAWILPGGKIEQLGPQWHHDWLDQNKDVQKKYGLEVPAFEGGDAEAVRESALKKGFVRINYGRNTGTLTVEARAKDWRKQKAAVEKIIETNLEDIDNVSIHLLSEDVSKVVDSASERLFNYDENVEKMANLPFITKGEVRGQFLPAENKAFIQELEKIRKGESGGQTFNADGSVWQSPSEPSDIVTLASVNIPRKNLTAAEFEKATAPYQELLSQPNVAAGVFTFEQAGKPAVSVDINAVVPQEFRDNSLAFAKANDQVAIWDAVKNETVSAGGSGNTRITSPEQMRAAAESLVAGEPFQFLPAEQTGLPGISSGREFDRKAIEGMSQTQLKEYFPEAIIPKKNTEYIPSDIVGSPLAKEAGNKEAAVQAFADKLIQFYRQYEDSPSLQAGAKWYSEFTPLLKKEFGKDSRIFAELLAATSPNNTPQINFAFALDALQNWKAGKYDKMISKFNDGLNKLADGGLEKIYQRDLKAGKVENPPESPSDATYLAHWITKNDLIPKSSSGKRFSMHSVPVLKVLARKWLELNTGLKTDNFIKNLVGEGDEATIDVWADRTMRRLGYEGFSDRWRILPRNKTGVTDTDFIFSQQAFRKAAEALELKPSALQGALWFAEKHLWSERGWGKLDLGDYRTELERMPQLRAGFASREKLAKAEAKAPKTEQKELEIVPR